MKKPQHKAYNGHKNWNHWNVSLWINNDQDLYNIASYYKMHYAHAKMYGGEDRATFIARQVITRLRDEGLTQTPDGAPYTITTIKAAMRGME